MKKIKYREWLGNKFHYWGIIDGTFISPSKPTSKMQQSTGFLDKNAKEIFEGDIVRYEPALNQYDGKLYVNEVIWEHDRFRLNKYSEAGYLWHLCEIIGNINENPELMETK